MSKKPSGETKSSDSGAVVSSVDSRGRIRVFLSRLLGKLPKSKKGRVILGVCALLLLLIVAGNILARRNSDGLSKQEQKEYQALADDMASTENIDQEVVYRFADIDKLIREEKYAEAKSKIEESLNSSSLNDSDKKSYVALLASVCVQLNDLACADKVVSEYGKSVDVDVYFLIKAAKLAESKSDMARKRAYLAKALSEVEDKGGQDYIDELNSRTDEEVDYDYIKQGAQ